MIFSFFTDSAIAHLIWFGGYGEWLQLYILEVYINTIYKL